MLIRVETHRDAGEASAGEELRKFLGRGRRWSFWIDVNHLSRAIDDHSKLRHFMRAEEAVEMWARDEIDLAFVGDLHRNVCECAVPHRQRCKLAYAVALRFSSDAADILFRLLDPQPKLLRTCPVDQSNRTAAVDH